MYMKTSQKLGATTLAKLLLREPFFSNEKIFGLPLTYAYATLRQSVAEKFDILGYYFAFYVQLFL
jgi:hypothetical protein